MLRVPRLQWISRFNTKILVGAAFNQLYTLAQKNTRAPTHTLHFARQTALLHGKIATAHPKSQASSFPEQEYYSKSIVKKCRWTGEITLPIHPTHAYVFPYWLLGQKYIYIYFSGNTEVKQTHGSFCPPSNRALWPMTYYYHPGQVILTPGKKHKQKTNHL